MMATTLFISDLHLSPSEPKRIQLAANFINTHASKAKALYLLGDVFNTWLGDDIVPSELMPFINELQTLHKAGIKTYLMVGNRDFMMGQRFAHHAGCELLDDHCVITLDGQRTLLLHGDTLCIDDIPYQRYRKWTRNPILQWCFRHLSTAYRQGISDKIKEKSRQQKQTKSAMIMDVNQDEVIRIMEKYNVTQLIHGHTHRPAFHSLTVNDQQAMRIVLGDWIDEISYLQYGNQQAKLIDYRITDSIVVK